MARQLCGMLFSMSCMSQVAYINSRIHSAKQGEPLFGVQLVEDPSDQLVEVYLLMMTGMMNNGCYITC